MTIKFSWISTFLMSKVKILTLNSSLTPYNAPTLEAGY